MFFLKTFPSIHLVNIFLTIFSFFSYFYSTFNNKNIKNLITGDDDVGSRRKNGNSFCSLQHKKKSKMEVEKLSNTISKNIDNELRDGNWKATKYNRICFFCHISWLALLCFASINHLSTYKVTYYKPLLYLKPISFEKKLNTVLFCLLPNFNS